MLGFISVVALFMTVLTGTLFILLRRAGASKKIQWGSVYINIVILIALGGSYSFLASWQLVGLLQQLATSWIMFAILLIGLLFLWLIGRYIYSRLQTVPVDEDRRSLMKGAVALPCLAATGSGYGSLIGKDDTVINEYAVEAKGLEKDLEGFQIAQLSDIHLGPFFDLDRLAGLLEKSAKTGADVLVITGDVFDDNRLTFKAARLMDSFVERFPQGIIYCPGNHEHFRGMQLVNMALQDTQITCLINENVKLSKGKAELYIAGVDYPMDRSSFDTLKEQYTKRALEQVPADKVRILLAHHPDFLDSAANYDVNLVLSGHTHGGQLGFLGIPLVPPVFKYMRGFYRLKNSLCYVHTGNGSWFPFRLGCPPEIAVFKLTGK